MNNEFNQDFYNPEDIQDAGFQTAPCNKRKSSRKNALTKRAGALVLSGLILGTTAGGAFVASTYLLPHNTSQVSSNATPGQTASLSTTLTNYANKSVASSSATAVKDITAKCMPSIVAITNKGVTETMTLWGKMQQPSESCGSGIIIAETNDELQLVTNYHVVQGSQTLTIVFSYDENNKNPQAVEAYIKGYDEDRDLAVLGVSKKNLSDDVLKRISIAAIGSSDHLCLGEQVVAIGNALGYGQSVTTGIVSALNRQLSGNEDGDNNDNTYIQTDAAINPGNSGGALFNMNGELVGINTAKISSNEIEGMGYAIPVSNVSRLIEELMNQTTRTEVIAQNERGSLGIRGMDSSTADGLPKGVYVYSVEENSAAANAGITNGCVITKFDGKSISSTESLQHLLTYYKAGEQITMTVQVPKGSSYDEKEFTVTLGKADITNEQNNSNNQMMPSDSYENPFNFPFGNEYSNGNQFA
ncbi:MAG: trypsin-like peptidase domain-containing protein [Clostridium sp.]|nr:trypsin-like peptidase domain-containing protein [Clostridium sp.]